jgi:hypothetical protein
LPGWKDDLEGSKNKDQKDQAETSGESEGIEAHGSALANRLMEVWSLGSDLTFVAHRMTMVSQEASPRFGTRHRGGLRLRFGRRLRPRFHKPVEGTNAVGHITADKQNSECNDDYFEERC